MFSVATIAACILADPARGDEKLVQIGGVTFEARSIEVEGSTVAFVDLNGDGRLDLVSAGPHLVVRLGDGAGGFEPGPRVAAGANPTGFAFADVNGDDAVDVVVANHETHYVTVLLGDGEGGLAPAELSPVPVDVDPHPHVVGLADLDGDGRADLLVDHSPRGERSPDLRSDPGGVLVMAGLGEGRFAAPGHVFASGDAPYRGFESGDLNGDGRPDVVTPHRRDVGVLLNTSEDGAIRFERGAPVEATEPFVVRLGDVDADEDLDLVVVSGEESDRVEVFLGDGRGGFDASPQSPLRFARGGKNVALGDFDGDGASDAAVVAYHSDRLLIVLGGESLREERVPAGHDHPWGLAAGDLNADGLDDLLVVGDGARSARLYLSAPR